MNPSENTIIFFLRHICFQLVYEINSAKTLEMKLLSNASFVDLTLNFIGDLRLFINIFSTIIVSETKKLKTLLQRCDNM